MLLYRVPPAQLSSPDASESSFGPLDLASCPSWHTSQGQIWGIAQPLSASGPEAGLKTPLLAHKGLSLVASLKKAVFDTSLTRFIS